MCICVCVRGGGGGRREGWGNTRIIEIRTDDIILELSILNFSVCI